MPSRHPDHLAFLEKIQPLVHAYTPCEEVGAYAEQLHVTAVIGPAGIGTNSLMAASGLTVSTAITSREPRDTDTIYRKYLDFTVPECRNETMQKLAEGTYIQIASNPGNGEVYASEPKDFPDKDIHLIDMTAGEYYKLQHANIFGNFFGIYIVTKTYEQWQQQWTARGLPEQHEYETRMQEAEQSIEMCLDDPGMVFLVNDDLQESGRQLGNIASGQALSARQQSLGRQTASLILTTLRANYSHRKRL